MFPAKAIISIYQLIITDYCPDCAELTLLLILILVIVALPPQADLFIVRPSRSFGYRSGLSGLKNGTNKRYETHSTVFPNVYSSQTTFV